MSTLAPATTTVTLELPSAAAEKLLRLQEDIKRGDPEAIAFAERMRAEGFPIKSVSRAS